MASYHIQGLTTNCNKSTSEQENFIVVRRIKEKAELVSDKNLCPIAAYRCFSRVSNSCCRKKITVVYQHQCKKQELRNTRSF